MSGQDAENPSSTDDDPATVDGKDGSTATTWSGSIRRAERAFAGWLRGIRPRRKDVKADVLAGLPGRSARFRTGWPPRCSPG